MPYSKKAWTLDPKNALYAADYSSRLRVEAKVDEAMEAAEAALESHPDDARLHFEVAASYQVKGWKDAALEHYQKACEKKYQPACDNLKLLKL